MGLFLFCINMIKKPQYIILLANLASVIFFAFVFFPEDNGSLYLSNVIIIFIIFFLIYKTNRRVKYPDICLWGLSLWGFMHLAGTGFMITNTENLYQQVLIPIIGKPYFILRYDQLVHFIGFGVGTLSAFYILKVILNPKRLDWSYIGFITILAGLGIGAVNEIIEFVFLAIKPSLSYRIGDYTNNMLDLVFDLLGSIIAFIYLYYREKKNVPQQSRF
jgi:uncharacterized membrane protein YjdF